MDSFNFIIIKVLFDVVRNFFQTGGCILGKKSKKVLYELQENETIASCLDRMKKDGYMPVRRMEKPIFEEKEINGKKEYVPVKQQIVFEGKSL